MTSHHDPDYEIGAVSVFLAEGRLVYADRVEQLEPRVMAVLDVLARSPGEVVSRDTLHEAVWGGAVVTEYALARCLSIIRGAFANLLASEAPNPVIRTLRKRGFRLELPVAQAGELAGPTPKKRSLQPLMLVLLVSLLAVAAWFALPRIGGQDDPAIRSIAVLPFLNLTGEPDLDYLADGFSEQLSHALANVSGLKVAARTSAFFF